MASLGQGIVTDFLSRAIAAVERQLQPRVFLGVAIQREAVILTASEAAALLSAVRQEPQHDPAPATHP